jgi:hypothetical protein
LPGAPNRPPEVENAPPAPPSPEDPARRVRRRLVPALVALRLPPWKGAPSPEILTPYNKARAAYDAGDFGTAETHLDQLAVRFAEPRWPSLPEPFKSLRVRIPAPQPPQWDPEFRLTPPEKEARQARREAELQARLVGATIETEGKAGTPVTDLAPLAAKAQSSLGASGVSPEFLDDVDAFWTALLPRLAAPSTPASRAPPPAPVEEPA